MSQLFLFAALLVTRVLLVLTLKMSLIIRYCEALFVFAVITDSIISDADGRKTPTGTKYLILTFINKVIWIKVFF